MILRIAGLGLAAAAAILGVVQTQEVQETLMWTERAPLPLPVAGYMAGILQGQLVIAGGTFWRDGKKQWTTGVQRFDPAHDRWSDAAPLPAGRSDAASIVVGDALYVFGGVVDQRAERDALKFDGKTWHALPDAMLPEARVYAKAATDGTDVYVLGGLARAGDYTSSTTTFWRWRPSSGAWETLPPVPGPGRINHAMAVIDGRVYVFGGATGSAKGVTNLDDIQMFDPAARAWRSAGTLPAGLRAAAAVAIGDRAIVLGGYTSAFADDVLIYEAGQVRRAGHLPHAVADAQFFSVDGRILGTGGEAGPGVRAQWTVEARVPPTRRQSPR